MVSSISVVKSKKKRHVSKKNKINWRKNVDIQDVEDFLEDKRLEERLGTPFAEKPDSELFVIDTEPTKASVKKSAKLEKALTARQRKKLALPEHPRCFQAFINSSKVPEPSGKRNNVNPKKNQISESTEKKRIERGVYKKKLDIAKKNRALDRRQKLEIKECRHNIDKDLWGDTAVTPEKPAPDAEWLSKDTRDVNKPAVKPARPTRKAARAKPIVAPHPGTSYNPSFKDHTDLLQSVATEELKVIKEEKHLNRVTSGMFRKLTPQQKREEDLKELRQGLDEVAHPAEDEDADEEYRAINPPVRNRKKDPKKKRHMREENTAKAMRKAEIAERRKLADVYKLKFISKAVSKQEIQQRKERDARRKKRAENPPAPRINSTTFKEPPPLLLESTELSGNLRELKPKGGGLADQFTSLQRRGLISVSVPRTIKKAKMKKYTLSSHKMPWEITEGHAKPSKRQKK